MTSPGDATAQLAAKDKRIAELEAELDEAEANQIEVWSSKEWPKERERLRARAEKAEAELASVLAELKKRKVHEHCSAEAEVERLSFMACPNHPEACGCEPEGGGREKEPLSAKPRENDVCGECHGTGSIAISENLSQEYRRVMCDSCHGTGKPAAANPAAPPALMPKAEDCIHGVCSGTWLRVSDNVELPCPCRRCHSAAPSGVSPTTPDGDWGPYDDCPTCGEHRYREPAARKERSP